MSSLPDFLLETYFSKWEFNARYHLAASDAESLSMAELLSFATADERESYESLWLGYTETFGAPDLRDSIAATYQNRSSAEVLCFAGASEGIYAANSALLDKDSHAIVITPNYQSHSTLPLAICETTGVPLDPNDGWSLDPDRIAAAIRPNTRLLTINFPHNPTGAIPDRQRYTAVIEHCRQHGIYILHDEIFHGLGPSGVTHLPFVTDSYELGLSLNVLSKSYGLPGLRIGWIACQDKQLLQKMERIKHYLSICNSAPSERLAIIALNNKDQLIARNCAIVDENLKKWDTFFARYPDLFEWHHPDGSCMGFPRYLGTEGSEKFCHQVVEESGVLLLPGAIYQSGLGPAPAEHFRLGCGRRGLDDGLAALQSHIDRAIN